MNKLLLRIIGTTLALVGVGWLVSTALEIYLRGNYTNTDIFLMSIALMIVGSTLANMGKDNGQDSCKKSTMPER